MLKIESFLKKNPIYPALILESYFNNRKRRFFINIAKYTLILIPVTIIISIFIDNYDLTVSGGLADFLIRKSLGLALISLSIYIVMYLFEAYFASTYYFELVAKNRYSNKENYTFSAGRILRSVINDNLLTGLLRSRSIGKEILVRLGINQDEINSLLLSQAEVKEPKIFDINSEKLIKVSDIINFIYENYTDFKKLLNNHGIDQKDLQATIDWVVYKIESETYNRQWWRPERLAKIPGVGSDWSFGRTYLLSKYSRNILEDKEVNSDAISFEGRSRELAQLQTVLGRSSGANAILVGEPGQEKMEVIWNLVRQIKNKTEVPSLIKKRPLLFLTSIFTTQVKDKSDFEDKIEIILSEALQAGNIILVIDNLPRLILQAKQFESNIVELLEPYLASSDGQIIALADTEYFHTLIENNKALMARFEVVQTKSLDFNEILEIISREALIAEKIYEITYTYPAILEIAKSADYYFPDGVSSDKANDLLTELSPWIVENKIEIVTKNDVLKYVGEKTNIPIAAISEIEKERLLDLENLIMKRVVAQREAVFAISSAIRRGRAGIRNEKRPIGSFLFLGPTGVGKTETAKALADVFFGEEKNLLRLDMSEYQNEEALARLIGSVENNSQGVLSNMLREHPYGVLLLDEFEKTNKNVLNLFLQIIDEGYFTDAFGKKVMARNIIFIATSNAGADKIFEIISNGKNLQQSETEIISNIIKDDILRPELINRFDGTILFHPLSRENLSEIAKLMLKKVEKRLADKGITLKIDNELIDFLTINGYNPTFGARPMNRLIQDIIEDHLSDLIIRGQLIGGKTISFKILSNENKKESLKPIID